MKITVTSDDGTFKKDVYCEDIDLEGAHMNRTVLDIRFRQATDECWRSENQSQPKTDDRPAG